MIRRWFVWLPITVILLVILVWRTRPWEAAALETRLDAAPLGAALALNVFVVLAWAARSRALMASVGAPLGTRQLIPIVSFANTINNLTPASSGEVLRAVVLRRRHAIAYVDSTAVIIVERLGAIGIMLVTALAASVGTIVPAPPPIAAAAWAAALGLVLVPPLAYRRGIRPARILARLVPTRDGRGRLALIADQLGRIDERLAAVLTNDRSWLRFVGLTGLIFATFALQLWLVLVAFDVAIEPLAAWAALGLSICVGVVSALPFGLGAADVALVALLGLAGADVATAAAAALMLRTVATLPLGILGLASWLYLSRDSSAVDRPVDARLGRPSEEPVVPDR